MRSLEEFEVFLKEAIEPTLGAIDREREAVQEKRDAARLPGSWKLAGVVAGITALVWLHSFESVPLFAGLPFAVDAWRRLRVPDTATPRLRTEVLAPVIEFWDPSFRYEPHGSIAREEFSASRLFEGVSWNRYHGEDLASGRHGSTAFRFSEIGVAQVRAWIGELLFATSIIDELDLDTRIWSKAPAA